MLERFHRFRSRNEEGSLIIAHLTNELCKHTRIKSCKRSSFFLIYRLGFMMTVIYAIFDEKLLIYYYRKRFARKKFIFIINFFNSQSMMIESKVTYKFKLI